MTDSPVADRPAGDLLLHPISLVAIVVLVLNDHVLKQRWPSAMTGKLSDVAGVLVVPLLMMSLAHVVLRRRWPRERWRPAASVASIVITATGFAAVKLVGPVGDTYALTIGALRWLARLGGGDLRPIEVVRDPSDVLVLPVLIVSYYVMKQVDRVPPPRDRFVGQGCRA